MGKIVETRIDNFSGGILEDKRAGWVGSIANGFTTRFFGLTKHFDVFTNPKKLVPHYSTVADELSSPSTKDYRISKFIFCSGRSGTYGDALHGLGVVPGTTKAQVILYNDLTGELFNGFTGSEGNAEGTGTGRNNDVFFYYKDYIYLFVGSRYLCRYNSNDAGAFNNNYFDYGTTYTSVAEPVRHPSDDAAYFFIDNKVYRLNNVTWDGLVLTLPNNLKIVSCCPYGNYLAIGCTSTQILDRTSVVYLWDRDSSLATLTDRVDFGEGELKHLANLNNKLIGIISFYADNRFGLDKGKILVKVASGDFAIPLNEILVDDDANAFTFSANKIVKNNKLYFVASAPLKGDTRHGIWVVDENGSMTLDFVEFEVTTGKYYQGIYSVGNMWWIAHSSDGSINRTSENGVCDTTNASIYESLVFNAGDSSLTKQLVGATVTTEKMPAAGQIVLKYRIDGATSWTTIFTNTTDSSIEHSAVNIESSGAVLPQYKEIEFRIESTGGAVITGLNFKSEMTDKKLY